LIEYKLEGVDKDIHCLFCGTRVGYDENGELGECNHLVYCSSGETSDDIELYNELFDSFDEDEDYIYEYLIKKLDDTYIMVTLRQPPPSGESFHIILKES